MPLISFVKQVIDGYGKDKVAQLSAAFSYTAIFALAPLLLVVISLMGFFFGQKAVQGKVFGQISDIVGPSTAQTIQNAIIHTHNSQHGGLAFVLGLLGSLLAAAALTSQLQNAFDVIFGVVPDPKAGLRLTIYTKIKNALILVVGSLIVVVSILATALISHAGDSLQARLGIPKFTLEFINVAASLAIFVLLLYLIYRVLPDVRLPRKVVFYAALIVGLLFLVGKIVLGVVIGHNGTASAYGAAASLITLLLWFYYTSQILFIGAEGMKLYLNNRHYIYRSKRYTLRQKTINIKTKNDLPGRSTYAFANGFTKRFRLRKK